MTPAALKAKWLLRFRDNDTFDIDEEDLREFVTDLQATFIDNPAAIAAVLTSLGRGLKGPFVVNAATAVKTGEWWLTDLGIWEGLRDFTANALPAPGANWKRVIPFSSYTDAQAVQAVAGSGQFATSAMLSGYLQQVELNRPLLVVSPSGAHDYCLFWSDLGLFVQPGSQVRLRGAFGNASTDLSLPTECTLVLEPGSVLTCRTFYAHGGAPDVTGWKTRTIEGTGTLRGKIMWYGDSQVRLTLRNFRHEGSLEHNSYGSVAEGRIGLELRVSNVEAVAPAGVSYFAGFYRNGGFYTAWYQASFYQCRISTMGAAAVTLSSTNNDGGTDAGGKANNRLRIVGSTFFGDGANKILSTTANGQACTFQFGGNFLERITAPTETTDAAFQGWGVGGSGGSSTGPTQPDAPTLTSQIDTDNGASIVFAANSTEPSFAGYEWRYITEDGYTKPWQKCTGFTIVLGNESIPTGGFELRQATNTEAGTLAGKKAVSTMAFGLKVIYGITFKAPRVEGNQVTFIVSDNSDVNTRVYFTDTVTGTETNLGYKQVNNGGLFVTLPAVTVPAGRYQVAGQNGGSAPSLLQIFTVV